MADAAAVEAIRVLDAGIAALRGEVAALREETGAQRLEIAELRHEIAAMRRDFAGLRGDLMAGIAPIDDRLTAVHDDIDIGRADPAEQSALDPGEELRRLSTDVSNLARLVLRLQARVDDLAS